MGTSRGKTASVILSLALGIGLWCHGTSAQMASSGSPAKAKQTQVSDTWWKHAVIYEIYPRSFQDSNNDGVGDLNGITRRLDYLKTLGVDAIWLSPAYPSPQIDFGYDISNYVGIDPQYGTMADFDRLVAEGKKRNIRVIMDLVLNHTSDKHPWFIESASSKSNPKRDWYVWRDGKGPGQPPNNWQSDFGHSAWQFDPKTKQYYYHKFYIQQPDLNWDNPLVRKAMYDVVRFWVNHGVSGFRLDAITTLFEDPALADEPIVKDANGKPEINAYGDAEVSDVLTNNLPKLHDVLRELRKTTDSFKGKQVVLIGETYLSSINDLKKMYGADDELQLPMDMQIGFINKLDVGLFRQRINEVETSVGGGQPMIVVDNHDNPRWDRYGDGEHNSDIGRVLATILFLSRDTALMYYGDEIGMVTTPPTRKEDVKDPIGVTGWPKEKGRDGERTPMQWDDSANAGFTAANVTPWLPVPASYTTNNVKAEVTDFNSMLNWYKQLIELRRTNATIRDGKNIMLNTNDSNVLSWMRQAPGQPAVVVACNFTAKPQKISLDLSAQGITSKQAKTLMKTPGSSDPSSLDAVELPPFSVYVGQVE
jgi:alpha-glucosidase